MTTINPLTGMPHAGAEVPLKITGSDADIRPIQKKSGPQFIMPALEGTVKLPSFLALRTLYEPNSSDKADLDTMLSHIVGAPVAPFDNGEGSQQIVVTGLKGYAFRGLGEEPEAVAAFLDECAGKDAPFKAMLDSLWKDFISMFFVNGEYKLEAQPRERDLTDYLHRVVARMSQAKNMARQIIIPDNVVETTFVMGVNAAVFPATYDNGGATPVVFRLASDDVELAAPEYFGNTQPRLAYIALQEICKYFKLGRLTPLILLALFEAYGTSSAPSAVTAFLQTVLVKINGTGKYTPKVYPNTREDRAKNLSVMSILYELYLHIILFAAFHKLGDSFSRAEMVHEVHIDWYNEYEDTFGEAVVNAVHDDMEWTGVPNADEGTFKIKGLPFGFVSDDVPASATAVEENAGSFGLVPLRLALPGRSWKMLQTASHIKTYGWMKSGNDTVPRPTIPAEFDPQIGLVCDSDTAAFLDLTMKGDAYAGWTRDNPYESPRMYRLAITRVTADKYNIGMGPMTLLDVVIDRHTQFGGNIMPFRVPAAKPNAAAEGESYVLSPDRLFQDVLKRLNKKGEDGEVKSKKE